MGHLTALWLLLWTSGANAATGEEFATVMLEIPPLAWVLALAAAALGGVISIISKMGKVPPAIEVRPGALATSMLWSIIAGALGFLGALSIPMLAPTAIPIVVFGCAVTGRPVIDWITGIVSARFRREGGGDASPGP